MFTTGGTVGLAEEIIDDTCLNLLLSRFLLIDLMNFVWEQKWIKFEHDVIFNVLLFAQSNQEENKYLSDQDSILVYFQFNLHTSTLYSKMMLKTLYVWEQYFSSIYYLCVSLEIAAVF